VIVNSAPEVFFALPITFIRENRRKAYHDSPLTSFVAV
jgi:hypothetical protein